MRATIGLVVMVLGFVLLYMLMNGLVWVVNLCVDSPVKTAVFTSGGSWWRSKACDLGVYTPITLKQNLLGYHVDWYSHADMHTVFVVMDDEKYQNVVFIGHGTHSSFQATDGGISSRIFVIAQERFGSVKKTGMLIQHTCCHVEDPKQPSLREAMLEDPSKGYSYAGWTYIRQQYLTAWKMLFADWDKEIKEGILLDPPK